MAFTLDDLLHIVASGHEEKIYKSRQWKNKRIEILKRDKYECQMCKKIGKYHIANVVHHKEELLNNPSRAFDNSNLISLCWMHHEMIHGRIANKDNIQDVKQKKFMNDELW